MRAEDWTSCSVPSSRPRIRVLGMYLAVNVVLDADGNAIEQPLLLLLLHFLELILTAMNEVYHTVHLLSHLQSLSREASE